MTDNEKWSWRTHPKRFIVVLIVVTLVMAVLGVVGGTLSNAVFGACVTPWSSVDD